MNDGYITDAYIRHSTSMSNLDSKITILSTNLFEWHGSISMFVTNGHFSSRERNTTELKTQLIWSMNVQK